MKHAFTVYDELDTPVSIAVAAYLDCEHYLFLHGKLSDRLEIVRREGFKITVRQTVSWLGLTFGHVKTGEYVPPAEFLIYDVVPSPWWRPSIHHVLGIRTRLRYTENAERKSTLMRFDVELDMPFWLYPFRKYLQKVVEELHQRQNDEDMAMIKRRARLYGRENNAVYLAEHHFCYHKDAYIKHFGKPVSAETAVREAA